MALGVLEAFEFGGVDSRSNPLNFPRNRSLRMKNFAPQDSGVLQLRYGFSTVTMSTVSAQAFHSVIPYSLFDDNGNETDYVILGQGTGTFKVMNIATGAVSTPTMKGTSFSTSAKCASYHANNREHIGNGTNQKFFDGSTYRDNGLRSLTATEVANIVLTPTTGEFTPTENSTISISAAAGGTFPATTGAGFYFYVVRFDTSANELGAATINAGSARVTCTVNQKFTLSNLPTTGGLTKLFARTGDSLAAAYFCTNTSTAVTSCTRSSTTLTVVSASHGLSTGDIVVLSGTTNFDSVYSITVSDVNTFTATLNQASGQNVTGTNTTGGTCKRIVSVAAATTTVDITSPNQDTSIVVNDTNRGLAVPAAGLANSGYQFYAAIYNPSGGGHVGNRIQIGGGRIAYSVNRFNVRITGLPDLSGTDSEWQILIGRTGDGGQTPYACVDTPGNFLAAASGQTSITLTTQGALNGTAEMPTRNGVIPSGLNMFAKVNDRIHGAQFGRPYIYISEAQVDSTDPDQLGRPEQSFASDSVETFPTGKGLQGVFEVEGEGFYGTKDHGAILSDVTGARLWRGPWPGAGMAGSRAWCDTPYGKFWVTGNKQLATLRDGLPMPVSDEYEAALLSKIGDANLSSTEMFYIRDVAKRIDHILIKALDSNGSPFQVIHDFRLRDERNAEGQGYEGSYSSPLSVDFVLAKTRDSGGVDRLWAGASTGQLYQLHTGANDAGTEYAADAIFMLNAGPDRPSVPEFRWYGDQSVVVSTGHTLDSTVDANADTDFEQLTPQTGAAVVVPGGDHDFQYAAKNSSHPEIKHLFLRIQLTSHSADGNLDLNSPPHVPLENYGRIYLAQGLVGNRRGA